MQRLCFMVALITYLETEKLVSREEVAALLGSESLSHIYIMVLLLNGEDQP